MKHIFNVRRAKHDPRDYKFSVHRSLSAPAPLPAAADLRPQDMPVRNQGQTSCCTGFSWTAMHDFVRAKKIGVIGAHAKWGSPEFLYYAERVLEGDVDKDQGANMREGGNVLAKYGVCFETTWPFDESRILKQPSPAAYAEALLHKNLSFFNLASMQEMKQCLADGFPFVFGFDVPQDFQGDVMASSGRMPMASWQTPSIGGHAVMCVGYDDVKQEFIVRNSWSSSWGSAGYFFMPYALFAGGVGAFDCYTIRL